MTYVKWHQLQGRGCLSFTPCQDQAECLCFKTFMFPLPFWKRARWRTQACSGKWDESYTACCFLLLLQWDKGQQYYEGLIYTTNWLKHIGLLAICFCFFLVIMWSFLLEQKCLPLSWCENRKLTPRKVWKNEKFHRSFLIKCHFIANKVCPGSQ